MTSAPTGLSTQALTRDHRPEAADERERVEAAGGRVTDRGGKGPLRCYTAAGGVGLMLTRSLGDLEMHNCAHSRIRALTLYRNNPLP